MISEPLLICLLAGHFCGAILLQAERAILNPTWFDVLKQGILVTALSYLLTGWWAKWEIPLILFLAHCLIGTVTRFYSGKKQSPFLKSQAAYLFIIMLLVMVFGQNTLSLLSDNDDKRPFLQSSNDHTARNTDLKITSGEQQALVHRGDFSLYWVEHFGRAYLVILLVITGLVLSVKAGGLMIGIAVAPFQKQIKTEHKKSPILSGKGLKNGGKLIGQLERAVIFILFFAGMKTGIGFLIAAKSILRFGEIKNSQQRMEAEYIIIGTLMSFGFGILVASSTLAMIDHLK
ncbi:hypothetical protein GF406_00690 [candidate division KSB1 bacterium]|nr:hypothetical protein [candidate division KSB1 bacterium]